MGSIVSLPVQLPLGRPEMRTPAWKASPEAVGISLEVLLEDEDFDYTAAFEDFVGSR